MKKKVVDEVINGILLAIVTINVFVVFLPQWIAIALGLLILCKLLYEYLPAITRKLYETPEGRIFTKKWWIRLLILGFAIPGYFMTFLTEHVYLVLYILVAAVFTFGFPLAYAWNKENEGAPPDQQSFWKVIAKGMGENIVKKWEECKKAPNKLSAFCWYYGPGVGLSATGLCFSVIFLLISSYSQFFTIIFIGWLLGNIFTKSMLKGESPDIKLLKSPSAFEGGWKGIFGFVFILWGFILFAIPGMIISLAIFSFSFSNVQYLLYLPLVYLLPPCMYQFFFWYAILERFPHFLHCWRSGVQRDEALSLPTGQIYAFIGSCISPFYIYTFTVPLLEQLFYLKSFYLLFSMWFLLDFAFVALIVHTLIKWRRGEKSRDVHKDNVRMPLALSAQLVFLFLVEYFTGNSLPSEISFPFLLISMVMIIVFFADDWRNFSKHRYGVGLTSDILGILPIFVVLIIANIITFAWAQPIFYLILTLSIIAVPFGIPKGSYKMMCYLLHKFYVLLTNEIVKALDIIKKSCNRLFLALRRKEVINKVINGILLAVVTVNTFVSFLPKYTAIALGVLILGKLLYEYLPAITTRKNYGCAEQQWVKLLEKLPVRMFIVCFAALGYFLAEVTDIVPTILITMVFIIALAVSFQFAAWSSAKVREPFWNVIAEVEGNPAFKNLGEYYKNLPDSLIKKIEVSFWWYLPGIIFSALCICFSGIFYVISIYSQFFTIIFVGWILNNISTKFKWKSKNLDIEKKLLTLPLAIKGGAKGLYVYLLIFGGFVISGAFILSLFSQFPSTKVINILYLLLLSPLCIYQFVFWYAMLMRSPSFIYCWKNGFSKVKSFSLPAGGLYAFIGGSLYICALFAFANQLRDWKWILEMDLSLIVLSSVMSSVYFVLILYTIKKWREKETADDIRKDNIRLPLAFFVQLLPPFVLFYKADPIYNEHPLYIMLVIGVSIVTTSLFFIQDWRNFLIQRYGNGLTKKSLSYFPVFAFLLLVNLLTSIWIRDIFYLILALSIIAVFLMCLEICITYRKKQLSRAKKSRKANSINHNEEKK